MKQQEAFDLLNDQLQDIPKVQIRSMSLAVLPRLMNVLDKNHKSCPDCNRISHEGEVFVRNIRPVFEQDIPTIKKFERWVNTSQAHLKNRHGQVAKGKTTALYTAVGVAIGILLTLVFIWMKPEVNTLAHISLGWVIGMLGGYVSGKLKETSLAQKEKLY